MEETVHDITTKIGQINKSMKYTDKEEVDGSFILKTSRNNTMHTFFYSNISEFAGKFQVMIDKGTYKTTIHNMHKLGCKAQLFNSADILMSNHGCGVSQCPQFYDIILKIKCYHVDM